MHKFSRIAAIAAPALALAATHMSDVNALVAIWTWR